MWVRLASGQGPSSSHFFYLDGPSSPHRQQCCPFCFSPPTVASLLHCLLPSSSRRKSAPLSSLLAREEGPLARACRPEFDVHRVGSPSHGAAPAPPPRHGLRNPLPWPLLVGEGSAVVAPRDRGTSSLLRLRSHPALAPLPPKDEGNEEGSAARRRMGQGRGHAALPSLHPCLRPLRWPRRL
jgi:hypothetical protein